MSTSSFTTSSVFDRPLFLAKLLLPGTSQVLSSLIDSGTDANFINKELVCQLRISKVPLSKSVPARALDGHLLGMVTHQTEPVNLLMSGNHNETIQFHVLPSSRIPLILGRLVSGHNPQVEHHLQSNLPQAGNHSATFYTAS